VKWPSSDIAFSQVREDPLIEEHVIRKVFSEKKSPLDILIIGSGGCTVLGMADLPEVHAIDCVDANYSQLALIQLRQESLRHLSRQQQFTLFGICGKEAERIAIYQQLLPFLSEDVREYWSQHAEEIAFGVNRVGKFEELFRELALTCTKQLGFLAIDDPHQAIHHPKWQNCFDIVFEREKLAATFGRAAVEYSMSKSFANHFSDVFSQALQKYPRGSNYFVDQVWLDHYSSLHDNLPLYLMRENNFQAQIHFHHGPFLTQMQALNKKWDIIQTSNISDWMPIPQMKEMFTIAKSCLKDKGALISRRLNGDHILSEIMQEVLFTNNDLNNDLKKNDRSYFYSEVVVGFKNEESTRC